MARLRDIGHVWSHIGPWTFLKRVYSQMSRDNLLVWAAALSYSWLFAVFPFLIFCLSILPLLPEKAASIPVKPDRQTVQQWIDAAIVTGEDTQEAVKRAGAADPEEAAQNVEVPFAPSSEEVEASTQPVDVKPEEPGVQPAAITETIGDLVDRLLNEPSPRLATISLLIALFTASGGMAMTMAGLDKCYDVAPEKQRPIWRSRPMAMLLTLVLAAMVLTVVVLVPVTNSLLTLAAEHAVDGYRIVAFLWLTAPLRYVLGFLLLLCGLAVVYRWGPSVRTRMHLFSPGSVFCVVMWVLTAVALRVYLNYFGAAENYQRTYGAVAGVAVLMLVFYLDALFLLIGAEMNAEIDFIRLGIRSGPLPEERKVAPVPAAEMDEEDRELKQEIEEHRDVEAEHRGEVRE